MKSVRIFSNTHRQLEKEVAASPSARARQPILGTKFNFFVFVFVLPRWQKVRMGFSLFSSLDFNLFGIIILKVRFVNTTITYYQIIENMVRENSIGENIKKYRTKQGLSQEDFAKKSGVKYTTLTKIESGVIKKPFRFGNGKNCQSVKG